MKICDYHAKLFLYVCTTLCGKKQKNSSTVTVEGLNSITKLRDTVSTISVKLKDNASSISYSKKNPFSAVISIISKYCQIPWVGKNLSSFQTYPKMKNMFSSQQQRKEVSIIPLLAILYHSSMRLKSSHNWQHL